MTTDEQKNSSDVPLDTTQPADVKSDYSPGYDNPLVRLFPFYPAHLSIHDLPQSTPSFPLYTTLRPEYRPAAPDEGAGITPISYDEGALATGVSPSGGTSGDTGNPDTPISPIFSDVPSTSASTINYGGQNPTGDDNRNKASDENLDGATTNLTDYETYIGSRSDVNHKRLSEIIANYESNLTNFVDLSNNTRIKINFIIFPKYITSENDLKNKSYILRYKTDVLKFSIKSRIRKFGYTGEMIMVDNNNSLRFLFNNMMNYYMAICISFPLDHNNLKLQYKSIIYEPYIVQLEEAEELTSNDNALKHYRIKFRDALSAIAQDISWASIYYFNPTLQYPISFETLITGVINHLYNISDQLTGDGKITLRKNILFSELSTPSQCSTNLASFCLSEIDPEGSVLDALDTILTYASCELPSITKILNENSDLDLSWFSENENSNILFPLYINEDYADTYYISKFLNADIAKNATSEKNYKTSASAGTSFSTIGNNSPIAKPIINGGYNNDSSTSVNLQNNASPPLSTGSTESAESSMPVSDEEAKNGFLPSLPLSQLEDSEAGGQIPAGNSTASTQDNFRGGPMPADDGLLPDDLAGYTAEDVPQPGTYPSDMPTESVEPKSKDNNGEKTNITDDVANLTQCLVLDKDAIPGHLFKPRHYIFKNILMPFQFAFNNTPVISESINPAKEKNGEALTYTADEKKYNCFFNRMDTPIYGYTTFPINLKLVSDMWKNIMFMGNMADESQTDIFYLEWIINYFAEVFLNIYESNKFPSPTPAFLVKAATLFKNLMPSVTSKNATGKLNTASDAIAKINTAAKLSLGVTSTIYNFIQDSIKLYKNSSQNGNATITSQIIKNEKDKELFNFYFSNVKVLKSLYPVAEECWHLGRYLESFVHYNTSYGFSIFGNLLRRTNEIIKFNKATKIKGDELVKTYSSNSSYSQKEETLAIDTTSANSDSVLLYVMGVEHVFEGDTFIDNLFCNRFYDEIDAKIQKTSSSK